MPYDAPGHADELSDELRERWNETIARAYASQNDALKKRFFSLDPDVLRDPRPTDAIKWPGDPGKPAFCVGEDNAQALSDWGLTGRRAVQLEYCEYMIVSGRDETGALRPKRVEITTEFREYWACIAMHDPDKVRGMAADVLGAEPSWEELYGVADPHALSPEEREIAFGHTVAGHGNDRRLRVAGVPAQPTGRLNMERALFMTHPINGIDDLIYVAIFGAHAYCVAERDQRRQAGGDDVFSAFKVTHLACNHADPTISLGVYDLVYHGAQVAFAKPARDVHPAAEPRGLLDRRRAGARRLGALQPRPRGLLPAARVRAARRARGVPRRHHAVARRVRAAARRRLSAPARARDRAVDAVRRHRPDRGGRVGAARVGARARSPATTPSRARRCASCSRASRPRTPGARRRARCPSPRPDGRAAAGGHLPRTRQAPRPPLRAAVPARRGGRGRGGGGRRARRPVGDAAGAEGRARARSRWRRAAGSTTTR